MKYAAFSKRFLAFLIDCIVLGFVMLLAQFTIPYFAPLAVWLAYKTLFEASQIQATPGKRAMELIVVDALGERITLKHSVIRTVIAWASLFTGFLLYLVCLFTARKQTVHDLVASTFVIEGQREGDPLKAWVDECKKVVDVVRSAIGKPRSPERDRIELLEKLARLRDSGAITESEFNDRKAAVIQETKA